MVMEENKDKHKMWMVERNALTWLSLLYLKHQKIWKKQTTQREKIHILHVPSETRKKREKKKIKRHWSRQEPPKLFFLKP